MRARRIDVLRVRAYAHRVKFALFPFDIEEAIDSVTRDFAAKRERVARLGAEDDMVDVDGAFKAAGLVGAFEVAGQIVPVLF